MDTRRLGRAGVAAAILPSSRRPPQLPKERTAVTILALPGGRSCRWRPTRKGRHPAAGLVPAGQTDIVINGVHFPTPSQPVEGFSAILAGRRPVSTWRCPTTASAARRNSRDFLIRAYYITPDFKTAKGGSGAWRSATSSSSPTPTG